MHSLFLDDFEGQLALQKSIISAKIVHKNRLEQRMEKGGEKNIEKERHCRLQRPIFEANAMQHAYNACAFRPNIYRSAWPSAICRSFATCRQWKSACEASWTPKMTPKMVQNGLQEETQTDSKSIFIVLEVKSKTDLEKKR